MESDIRLPSVICAALSHQKRSFPGGECSNELLYSKKAIMYFFRCTSFLASKIVSIQVAWWEIQYIPHCTCSDHVAERSLITCLSYGDPVTEHALIMCREPGRHSTLDKGYEEGGSAYANAGSSLRISPGYSRASPPQKNQSLPTVLLCALTSDFTAGCPPPPSRSLCQRVNLQLQFIKFLVILPFTCHLSLHLELGTHHAS